MKKIIAPLLLSTLACAAQAATITVDDDTDGSVPGACTLRDAVAEANSPGSSSGNCTTGDSAGNTIVFAQTLSGATIDVVVPNGIEITSNLVIDASSLSGGITLDANPGGSGPGTNRIFHVTGGDSLAITGVRFRNGNADGSSGGAIFVDNLSTHTLTLEQCAFEGNSAYSSGGAVFASSNATISNSSFEDNSATFGGAVYAFSNVTISNSSFEDNSANSSGGAVYAFSNVTISNSSFEGNSANSSGGAVAASSLDARHLTLLNNTNTALSGSGQALYIYNPFGSATLHNSIIIGSNGNDQCIGNGGSITGSYNLEGWASVSGDWQGTATSCGSSNPVTVPSSVSALGGIIATTLADNGGPTKTLALSANSPAIGAADQTTSGTSQMLEIDFTATPPTWTWVDATLDQRGYGRAASPGNRSIGAYEIGGTPPTPPSASGTPIPALPAPLLLMLAAAVGAAAMRQRRR